MSIDTVLSTDGDADSAQADLLSSFICFRMPIISPLYGTYSEPLPWERNAASI